MNTPLKVWIDNSEKFASEASEYRLDTPKFLQVLQEAREEDGATRRMSVKDPFRQHDWANIAIHTIARNIARTEFKLMTLNDEEIEEGDVFDLFNHVNPYMSSSQLWEASSAWMQCRGEFLWMLDSKVRSTLPTEIIVVDPFDWTAVLDKKKTAIMQWKYKDPDTGREIPYKIDQIIHIKQWNKWDRWRGKNPLIAQVENIEQDYQANVSNTSLIKNNSVPLGVITAQQIVNADQASQLVDQWETQNKGAKKQHRTAVLGKGASYQRVGLMPSEMQYKEMRAWNRNSILARYGVPPMVVGVKDDASALSGSDTKEQEKAFWTKKLIPEMKFIEEALETKFFKKYGLQMKGKFDYSTIPELQDDIHKLADTVTKLFAVGFTGNELNEKLNLGFEEQPWRDIPFRTSQVEEADPEEVEEPAPSPFPFAPEPEPEPGEESAKMPSWMISFEIESLAKWEKIIARYTTKLKQWFYEIRKWYLETFAELGLEERAAKQIDVNETYLEFLFWAEQTLKLEKIAEVYYFEGVAQTGLDLKVMFKQTGWDVNFDLTTIDAGTIVKDRLQVIPQISKTINKSMAALIQKAAKEGWTEAQLANVLRERFTEIGGKAEGIARTELGIIKSDVQAQEEAKKGVEKIYWIHTGRSKEPRPHHQMLSGSEVIRGETFSNGLRWPHDVAGDMSEIYGCTCEHGIVDKHETILG